MVTRAAVGLGLLAALPRAATAQFAPVIGSATGQITLASYNTKAGGALPFFNVDGQMLQAGGFYPSLNGINTNASTLIGALPLTTASGVFGNYGGGAANLFAVSGARAALVSTNYRVSDFNVANGIASATTLGGTAQWVNASPLNLTRLGGGFGSVSVNLGGKAGGFAEFGIDCLIQVGAGVGAAFVPAASYQSFIAYGYSGGAPTFSLVPATAGGVSGFRSVFNPVTKRSSFAAAALDPIAIPSGATVQVTGTLTLFGDPADISFDFFPVDGSIPLPEIGGGGSSNALQVLAGGAPEPGTFGLMLCGALGLAALLLYRRRHMSIR
jgi:hypothetical protein